MRGRERKSEDNLWLRCRHVALLTKTANGFVLCVLRCRALACLRRIKLPSIMRLEPRQHRRSQCMCIVSLTVRGAARARLRLNLNCDHRLRENKRFCQRDAGPAAPPRFVCIYPE